MEIPYQQLEREADFFKALANPVRLCILKGLMEKEECNCTVIREKLGIPQSTISQNISRLKSVGIIGGRRDGNEIYYRIVNKEVKAILQILCQAEPTSEARSVS